MEYLGLAAFAFAVVGYIGWSYRRSTRKGVDRHFGLQPGDRVRYGWPAEFDMSISAAAKVGVAAAGLLFGQLATLRPKGVTVALSQGGRLVLMVELENRKVERLAFGPDDGLAIDVLGKGGRRIQGGPSRIMRFTTRDGRMLQVLIHESAEPILMAWARRSEG